MINTVESFNEYTQRLPKVEPSLIQAAKSFAISAGVVSLLTLNPWTGLAAGAVAAIASTVDALVRPLFRRGEGLTHNLLSVGIAAGSMLAARVAVGWIAPVSMVSTVLTVIANFCIQEDKARSIEPRMYLWI